MDSNLRDLLDKIYELEGLVHLALKRDDSSEDFLRLISKKGREIGEICANVDAVSIEETPQPSESVESFSLEEYSLDEEPTNKEEEKEQSFPIYELKDPNQDEKPRGKLVFSINERFRFRKELFENSDADFNNTLALVASMEDYEEAEDYFLNEEGFDSKNPIVIEFLDVIKKYFK